MSNSLNALSSQIRGQSPSPFESFQNLREQESPLLNKAASIKTNLTQGAGDVGDEIPEGEHSVSFKLINYIKPDRENLLAQQDQANKLSGLL